MGALNLSKKKTHQMLKGLQFWVYPKNHQWYDSASLSPCAKDCLVTSRCVQFTFGDKGELYLWDKSALPVTKKSVRGGKTKLKELNIWPSKSVITQHMPN